MDQQLKHWVALWDYLDGNFWTVCGWARGHLRPQDLAWQPIPQVASIGWNLQHLGEMLDHYLAHVFKHGEQIQKMSLFTMRSGSQDDGRFGNLEAITEYHRKVRPAYRQFLAGLTGSNLDRVIEREGRRNFDYAWAIGHIAEHESYHLGKCTLLRSLLLNRSKGR
jgi:uncharacterized damage-inducible protein DinB